ncbi:MAG: hypothetical protein AAFW65_09390 [Pseudomonadota bacterium]
MFTSAWLIIGHPTELVARVITTHTPPSMAAPPTSPKSAMIEVHAMRRQKRHMPHRKEKQPQKFETQCAAGMDAKRSPPCQFLHRAVDERHTHGDGYE